jgi:predicted ATP-dependent serine protease
MPSCWFKQYCQCPECGKSHWRILGFCNICYKYDPMPKEEKEKHYTEQKGRQWSKKLHRYLTSQEIKNEKKGN